MKTNVRVAGIVTWMATRQGRAAFTAPLIVVVLGALLLESALVAGVPSNGTGEKLTIVNGYVFVDVSIGGKGPFRMMIDTGASSCSLTPEVALAAGLAIDYRVVLTTLAGERQVPAVRDTHFRVGSAEARGVEALVMEPEGIRHAAGRVDGVLGQSFLSRFAYLIDYRRKLLWLGEEADRQSGALTTEIVAERADGRVVLPVGIESGVHRWRLTLDTGANALVMGCGPLCPQLRDAHGGDRIVTNAGSRAVRRGTVRQVRVGTTIIPRAEAAQVDGPVSAFEDGVLPANWFSAIYVDSARNLVRLAK